MNRRAFLKMVGITAAAAPVVALAGSSPETWSQDPTKRAWRSSKGREITDLELIEAENRAYPQRWYTPADTPFVSLMGNLDLISRDTARKQFTWAKDDWKPRA